MADTECTLADAPTGILQAVADASMFAYRMDVEKGDVRDRAPVPDPILGGMQQESFLSAGSVTVTAC